MMMIFTWCHCRRHPSPADLTAHFPRNRKDGGQRLVSSRRYLSLYTNAICSLNRFCFLGDLFSLRQRVKCVLSSALLMNLPCPSHPHRKDFPPITPGLPTNHERTNMRNADKQRPIRHRQHRQPHCAYEGKYRLSLSLFLSLIDPQYPMGYRLTCSQSFRFGG